MMMKPVTLFHTLLLLVHLTLCAPASPNLRPLLSRIGISGADAYLGNFSPTSSYQTPVSLSTGTLPLKNSLSRSPSTRQLKLLRDLDLNHISDKELRKIIRWLTEKWPFADDLIQSIQELVDRRHSDQLPSSLSLLLPEPPSTHGEQPRATNFRAQLDNQIGHEPTPTPSSQVTLISPEFAKETHIHLPISILPEVESPFLSNNPTHIASSSSSSFPTPSVSTSPPAAIKSTTTTTAITFDNNLIAMLQTMDSMDELIIWACDRSLVGAAALAILALVLLFLISIVIVEVTDFVWSLMSTKLPPWRPNCFWTWERRRVIHLSGPERRLVAEPTADNDEEKRTEICFKTCDGREQC